MPRGSVLSEDEKNQIILLRASDLTVNLIAKKLNRSRKVIYNFLDDPENYGKNKQGGPKRKLSYKERRLLFNNAGSSQKSCANLAKLVKNKVTRQSVWKILHDGEIKSPPKTNPNRECKYSNMPKFYSDTEVINGAENESGILDKLLPDEPPEGFDSATIKIEDEFESFTEAYADVMQQFPQVDPEAENSSNLSVELVGSSPAIETVVSLQKEEDLEKEKPTERSSTPLTKSSPADSSAVAQRSLVENVPNYSKDECDVYANYIACKLRTYPEKTKNIVQHYINKIIFDADMGQLGNNS